MLPRMKKNHLRILVAAAAAGVLLSAGITRAQDASPTPSPVASPTPSPVASPDASASPVASPAASASPAADKNGCKGPNGCGKTAPASPAPSGQ